jgi:hypothetical protein
MNRRAAVLKVRGMKLATSFLPVEHLPDLAGQCVGVERFLQERVG